MKALVLAAGFGTRLLPHTRHTPKPLFTLGGQTLLDRVIQALIRAGCDGLVVNTHHLHDRIRDYLAGRVYDIPVQVVHEPEILGTGGAIRNLKDFWDDRPFMVVNSDILTDIDPGAVYTFHRNHGHPVTLALCDAPEFNTVTLDAAGRVLAFRGDGPDAQGFRRLTFTGIQVLDPRTIDYIPSGRFYASIDAYQNMIREGLTIRGWVAEPAMLWQDLGTPDRYREAAIAHLAGQATGTGGTGRIAYRLTRLKGDGSDRSWFRVHIPDGTLILADHGIRDKEGVSEADACVAIGRHLRARGVPVPDILAHDGFSGLVLMEDLGDTHLQDHVRGVKDPQAILDLYRKAVDILSHMWSAGADGFQPEWTWQSPAYDRNLILERECRYFTEAFLKGYLGMDADFEDLREAFEALADAARGLGLTGFMHRDFQSRNLMVQGGRIRVIDFQGGRLGPIQYDLAALLIDPYVTLPEEIRNLLVTYCLTRVQGIRKVSESDFRLGYACCRLTRSLQILGAYGYLSQVRGKSRFEAYVPDAYQGLKAAIRDLSGILPLEGLDDICARIDARLKRSA